MPHAKADRLPALTETQWQTQVIDLAKVHGWTYYHTYDSQKSHAGWPDLVLCRPPRILFIELKTDTGHVSVEQRQWIINLRACGMVAEVWRPRHYESIEHILRRWGSTTSHGGQADGSKTDV